MNVNINRNYDVSQIERTRNTENTSEKATSFQDMLSQASTRNNTIDTIDISANGRNLSENDVTETETETDLGLTLVTKMTSSITQNKELTDDQIAMFNAKYDFENMTTNSVQFDNFMNDLYNMGIISREFDETDLNISDFYDLANGGILTKVGETEPDKTIEELLTEALEKYEEYYEKVKEQGGALDLVEDVFKNYYETYQMLDGIMNTLTNAEVSTDNSMMSRGNVSFSPTPVEGMVFDERFGYVTPEYLEQLEKWSKQSEEYFANNPDIELPPLSDIDGLKTDKTDKDYTGTTFEELTDKQKDELRAILGDDTASSITSMEKLNDYLAKLVDFGVIKRSDAGVINGSVIVVNLDDNGNVIQGASQLNVNRDNWNGSVVEWFCRLEEDLVNKLGMFSADKNYSNATESARNELTRIREMQELIGKLFAEENN